ncbi:MAG: DUF1194 domain-containing protein [Alphaproteobacteria bacterium]|nr:DUF1194 domain-containing protein [Alphaproteobacteria bacterium]
MSRRLLAFAAALMLCLSPAAGTAAAQAAPARAVDLELVLAVDVSGSIDEGEAALQRQGYVDAFRHPDVIAAIRSGMLRRIAVAYFEWAGEGWQTPVLDWTVIETDADARAFADRLADAPVGTGPWTSISSAIDFAVPMFDANGVEGTRRVIDVSGDGTNNTGRPVPAARDEAVARGIVINGLPIMNDRLNVSRPPMPNLDLYFRNCVIGGPGAFVVTAADFRAFGEAIRRKLVLEIAGIVPPAGRLAQRAPGHAQFPPGGSDADGRRWTPPCDFGERRFHGLIEDP